MGRTPAPGAVGPIIRTAPPTHPSLRAPDSLPTVAHPTAIAAAPFPQPTMDALPWIRPDQSLPDFRLVAVAGMLLFIAVALQITQTKHRVRWPGWLVPAVVVVPLAGWSVLAILREGPFGFIQSQIASLWGMLIWYNLLASLAVAFFLLQNRARAAGMKSEIWVLMVALTAGLGLLVMLARMLYLEREAARQPSG